MIFLLFALLSLNAHSANWDESFQKLQNLNQDNSCRQETSPEADLCTHPVEAICNKDLPSFEKVKQQFLSTQTKDGNAYQIQTAFLKLDRNWKALNSLREEESKLERAQDTVILQRGMAIHLPPDPAKIAAQKAELKIKMDALKTRSRQDQAEYFALLSKQTESLLKAYGFDRASFAALLSDVKKHVLEQARTEKVYEKLPASVVPGARQPTREGVLAKLQNTNFVDETSIAQSDPETAQDFVSVCGSEGLSANAFNNQDGSVFVCPGMVLRILAINGGDLDGLRGILAHEFAHSIDGLKSVHTPQPNGDENNLDYRDTYQIFLRCIQNHYISDKNEKFTTDQEMVARELENLPKLEEKLERELSLSPLNLLEVQKLQSLIQSVQSNARSSHDQKPLELVKEELVADYYFTKELTRSLEKMPASKRKDRFKASFSGFCKSDRDPDIELLIGDLPDSKHPPERFRVEQALRNPQLRALLGCKPSHSTEKPWCSLSAQ